MKIWRAAAAAITTASLLMTGGCAAGPAAEPEDDRLDVAVAFYPFEFVAERVGGDQVNVANLTTPGAEPHDLELTPQQVASLTQVDLVIVQSGFQPAVDTAVEQAKPRRVVDTESFLTFLDAEGHEHEHEEDEAEGDHDEAEDDHNHGALDPHTWLDPTNMVAIAERVRDALIEARPEATQAFTENTAALVAELDELDAGIKAELTGCSVTTFITSHAAFGYFANRYGLTQTGIRGLDPDVEPSAARIAEVQRIAREQGVTTIFFETLVSPVVAQSIANDLGLETDVLDPIEGITAESRGTDYLEVMRANASALRTANQCG